MVYGGTISVLKSTFFGNSSVTQGGGIRQLGGTVTLRNSIVAGSNSGGNCAGSIANGSGNLVWGDTTCPGASANPQLVALANNGGPTQTMALGSNSAAVNLATPLYCPSTDQRELPRRTGYCDAGAFEAEPATITASSGTPQQAYTLQPFANPLLTTVVDSYDNSLGGVIVTFTAPPAGASASFSTPTATTASNGNASVTAIANIETGSYPVTATVSSLSTPATFNLTNIRLSVFSILRADTNPTNSASVAFTVQFNFSVTGVDPSDFALTVAGISGATVSSVSGSGTTYTVSVNTGSGDGTLRLDVVDDDTILDSSGQLLGGSGVVMGTTPMERFIPSIRPHPRRTSRAHQLIRLNSPRLPSSSPAPIPPRHSNAQSMVQASCLALAHPAILIYQKDRTFQVRALDLEGNIDPNPPGFSWTIDTTSPDTSITSTPSDPTSSTEASFSFISPDGSASFECSLDGSTFSACSSPAEYSGLAEGIHSFQVRAKDAAGNLDFDPGIFPLDN